MIHLLGCYNSGIFNVVKADKHSPDFELGLFKVAFTGAGALPSAVDTVAALPNTAALALRYQQLPGDEHVCGGLFSVICAKNHKGFLCRTCF